MHVCLAENAKDFRCWFQLIYSFCKTEEFIQGSVTFTLLKP